MAIIRTRSPMCPFFHRICASVALGLFVAIAPITAWSADPEAKSGAARSAGSAPKSAAPNAVEPAPKPDTYLCPHATGGAVDCFLHAVEHLYTMCRQVKSIEIIEFGYEKSTEGTNAAKSEYCVDKHRLSMTRPYQSALREATPHRTAVDGVRALHDLWLKALAELKWIPGESDDDYKARVARPYAVFTERAGGVRTDLAAGRNQAAAAAPKSKAAKATPKGKTGTTAAAPTPIKSAN